jgi:hypothetical protein
MRARIEAAAPSPLIDVDRDTGADPDRADLHVTIENLPAFGVGVSRAAAGEGGHTAILAASRTSESRPQGLSAEITRYPSMALQASSASVKDLKGEPPTLMAHRFS